MNEHEVKFEDGEFIDQAVYSKRTAKNGRSLFFKDKRLVSESSIPAGTIVQDLDALLPVAPTTEVEVVENAILTPEIEEETEEPPLRDRPCIGGDGPGEYVKFINGKLVTLCEKHYVGLTTGEIAELVEKALK